jgi:hypothetical protein
MDGTVVVLVVGEALPDAAFGETFGAGSVAVTLGGGALCPTEGVAAGAGVVLVVVPCWRCALLCPVCCCVEDAGVCETVRGRVPEGDDCCGEDICDAPDCACAATDNANRHTTDAKGNKNPFFIFTSEFQ